MRVLVQALGVLSFVRLVSAAACPFGQAAEAGLLNEADLASYNAVKRDGVASESFSELHRKGAVPEPNQALDERASNGPLPGSTLPGLTLPFGGGLCE